MPLSHTTAPVQRGEDTAGVIDPGFWAGRRVFLTGHTGFKGAWLSVGLHLLGARCVGYALAPPTTPSLFELARIESLLERSHIADIRDLEALRGALMAAEPEVVVHMAAQSLVRLSYQEPLETYAVNVMGTANLLEACRRCPSVRAVIVVTSDKCYENREWVWGYRENEPMGGYDPYSSSKGCAELVTSAFRHSFFNTQGDRAQAAVASARAGNVIGGGDWAANRLVPDTMRAFLDGQPVVVRNPHAARPWQHVLEPLGGYLVLAQRLLAEGRAFAEAWNFGPSEDGFRPVSYVVERLETHWGAGGSHEVAPAGGPHEAGLLMLDCAKARSRLRWRPRWSLDQGLQAVVEWYQAYRRKDDMQRVTIEQVQRYLESPVR